MLQEFGSLLQGHLLKENIKLYVYLQHALANDPDNAALMQGFRKEMNGISRTVTRFLKHYGEENWDRQRQEKFGHDLQAIGEVLVKRIETEESVLYPLYMAPGSYA
jgi:hemerythrin-like domain-containing protein